MNKTVANMTGFGNTLDDDECMYNSLALECIQLRFLKMLAPTRGFSQSGFSTVIMLASSP